MACNLQQLHDDEQIIISKFFILMLNSSGLVEREVTDFPVSFPATITEATVELCGLNANYFIFSTLQLSNLSSNVSSSP